MKKFLIFLVLFFFVASPVFANPRSTRERSSSGSKGSTAAENPADAAEAAASDEVGTSFTNEQVTLNNQAVDATNAGNFQKAEELFRAMLHIGEFNVIWFNLGRTYASQGKCIEAREALMRVAGAPPIREIPKAELDARAQDHLKELDAQCSGSIVLQCRPAEMTISINGGVEFDCHSMPIALVPGEHSIYAKTSYGFTTKSVTAVAGKAVSVEVEVVDLEKLLADGGLTPEERAQKSFLFKTLGYTFIGVGAATAIGGGVLAGVSYSRYQDLLEKNKNNQGDYPAEMIDREKSKTQKKLNISYGLIAGGSAILVTGVVLVIVDAVNYAPRPEGEDVSSFQFLPYVSVSADGAGMGVTLSF